MSEFAIQDDQRLEKQDPNAKIDTLEINRVWRNRRNIKTSNTQASFIRYLFIEYRKIRYFGNVTHIFFPRVFPPGVQLSKDVGITFEKYLQPCALKLFEVLSVILNTGWHYLDKIEYNLIVIMKKICEKIGKTDFSLLDCGDRNLVDRFRSLESLFLVLHHESDQLELLYTALKRVVKKLPGPERDGGEVVLLARRILGRDDELPSLYNFLLGLNMLKYRRYFDLQELIQTNCGEVVSNQAYECGKDTQKEIDLYIEETIKALHLLQKRRMEIARVKRHVPIDETGEYSFKILEYFYESTEKTKKQCFSDDREDVLCLSGRLFSIFVSSFEHILNGKILIPGSGRVELFSKSFFQMELARVSSLIEKLGKLSFHFQYHFTLEQYLVLRQPGKVIHRLEAEAKQLIDEGLAHLSRIGMKLEYVLRMRVPKKNENDADIPLEPGILSGRAFHLPYEGRVIKYKSRLGGKTVAEALAFIVRICFLSGLYFRTPELFGLLGEEEAVNREIQSKLEAIGRIAQPHVLQELKNLFSPSDFVNLSPKSH